MKRELLVLLAAVTLTVAMVPKPRRAVDMEGELLKVATSQTQTSKICLPETPCAWSIYSNPVAKVVETVIVNKYCECGTGTKCTSGDIDSIGNVSTHNCRKP